MSEFRLDSGTGLEFQTAAYFQAHGYLVRRAVKLAIAAGTAEATDIDVLAIRFSIPLSEERLVVDCKARKKPKPFERVLWALGLASFCHADRAVVVLPRTPWQAREFASQGGTEILGIDVIRSYFRDTRNALFHPFSEADPKIARRVDLIRSQKKDHGRQLIREDLRLRQRLVTGHPLANLNTVIRMLSSIGQPSMYEAKDISWLRRYVCFNAAVVAGVMLVRFATESKWMPEKDWTGYATKKLTYGDIPPQKAKELARLALNRDFYNGLPTPNYTDEILQVISLLISQPHLAAIIPYALDFRLFGQTLGNIPDGYTVPALGERQKPALGIGERILSALAYAAGLPASMWDIGNDSDTNNNTNTNTNKRDDLLS